GDVSCNLRGKHDSWISKTDSLGTIQWQQCFGGSLEEGNPTDQIIATSDGGSLFITETWSFDGDVSGQHGFCDILAVKLDANGSVMWSHTWGGSEIDNPRNLLELPGQRYLLVCRSFSHNGDVPS